MSLALMARLCGTSHWLAMRARLIFLTDSPASLECFAEAPRNLAGRPLPSPPERPIHSHQRRHLRQPRVGETELGDEEPRVGVKHLEVARRAALIAKI